MDLEEIIVEFHREKLPDMVERELKIPPDLPKIIAIIGIRRCGKTYLLYQISKELLKSVKKEEILYINFEDERLSGFTVKDFSKINELYFKLNPEAEKIYLIFDEIQNVDNWQKFLRRVIDKKNYRIFITGSSSKLLSKEIATSLRGRTLSFSLLPFSFGKFLTEKGFKVSVVPTEKERGIIKSFLEEYLHFGGFPEIVNYDKNIKLKTLKEYWDLMIYKDLVERYKIKNIRAFKYLMRLVVESSAKEVSIRKIYNFLTSQKIKVSKTKAYEYFSFLEDINFVFPIRKFSYKFKAVEGSIPKLYVCDNGFINLFERGAIGMKMENLVAIELMRREFYKNVMQEIFYWKDYSGKEVDFVVNEGSEIKELIQVCYDISNFETKERELKSLVEASKELKCDNLLVITYDYEGEEEFKGKNIGFIPLWKWLIY